MGWVSYKGILIKCEQSHRHGEQQITTMKTRRNESWREAASKLLILFCTRLVFFSSSKAITLKDKHTLTWIMCHFVQFNRNGSIPLGGGGGQKGAGQEVEGEKLCDGWGGYHLRTGQAHPGSRRGKTKLGYTVLFGHSTSKNGSVLPLLLYIFALFWKVLGKE